MKSVSLVALVALVLSATACEDKLQQMKKEGIACGRDKSMLIAQKDSPKQHCFVCTDDASMMKCTTNPITSGCTETPCTAR